MWQAARLNSTASVAHALRPMRTLLIDWGSDDSNRDTEIAIHTEYEVNANPEIKARLVPTVFSDWIE